MILDFKIGEDYIEVLCGATNKKYGDYVGRLKINNEEAFEKHALREGSGRWKRNIWVHCEDEDKVPLWKTPGIKYYTHQTNVPNRKGCAMRKQNFHRDEFLRCTRCRKERRITCDDDEERSSLKASRGCSRSSTCQGCSTCYYEGCIKCRFEDCNCQECRDFMLYAEP
ncbi:Protein ULTRAPETALA 2 [Glycine soja]|uniref:Protein ULTRAPETALA 2 n=1 Tax=Glycine soja TaxID=3848 RepID=A0A445KE95_GLYSO|nr:Protein ULTRAPETALA 2 [Glycine soja]